MGCTNKISYIKKLHPNVIWIIRLHSETLILANEGIAFDWLGDYLTFDNVIIAVNAKRILNELREFIKSKFHPYVHIDFIENRVIYLPNYYPQTYTIKEFDREKDHVDISCFGAIRPLKIIWYKH
jgi:hypothetical protein